MRSGWPSEDGRGMPPANQGHVPFGPEVSWPNAYSRSEYADGGHGYPATRGEQLPAVGQGQGQGAADAARAAGDDRDAARYLRHQ